MLSIRKSWLEHVRATFMPGGSICNGPMNVSRSLPSVIVFPPPSSTAQPVKHEIASPRLAMLDEGIV